MMAIDLNQIGINPTEAQSAGLLSDLQGNILKSHGRDHAVHLFLRFTAGSAEAHRWIKAFSQQYVTAADRQLLLCEIFRSDGTCGGLFGNFLLSAEGYRYLGFPEDALPPDPSFRLGMKARGAMLSDPPIETWDPGFQGELHAMVLLADDQAPRLASAIEQVRASLEGVAQVVAEESGATFRNEKGQAIEHFGFVDGISQPLFLKDDIDSAANKQIDRYDPSAPLSLALRPDPLGEGEHSYGSYLVFRKLEQNVQRFRALESALADCLGADPELASAYAVGRFRDGTPIALHAAHNDAGGAENNFNFEADPGGKCPVHAHIRRANPRGSAAAVDYSSPEEERRHRIVRRGISYGVLDLNPPPGEKVGLLFMCFQGDIADQFEMMQAAWANDGDFLGADSGIDPIVGHGQMRNGGQRWPIRWGDNDQFLRFDFSSCVNLEGGEYFFAPSLSFLLSLA